MQSALEPFSVTVRTYSDSECRIYMNGVIFTKLIIPESSSKSDTAKTYDLAETPGTRRKANSI
jgi:hypothetical protein